jgi:hypothetical protein
MRTTRIPRMVLSGPPTLDQVKTRQPTLKAEELQEELMAAMLEYQTINSALWDAIRHTVTIAGPYETIRKSDWRQRSAFLGTPRHCEAADIG